MTNPQNPLLVLFQILTKGIDSLSRKISTGTVQPFGNTEFGNTEFKNTEFRNTEFRNTETDFTFEICWQRIVGGAVQVGR